MALDPRSKKVLGRTLSAPVVSVEDCVDRYFNDHLSLMVAQDRARIAWLNMRSHFKGQIAASQQMYERTANYYKIRVARGASPSTVRRELAVLNAAFKHCHKIGLIPYVPPIYRIKESAPRWRVLTKTEVDAIFNEVKHNPGYPIWFRDYVMLLAYTGQRSGAVLALTWQEVDFAQRIIHFNNIQSTHAERRKGRGTVPMTPHMIGYLSAMRQGCPGYFGCVVNFNRSSVSQDAVLKQWHKMRKAVGLGEEVTPHVMRHTFASMLVAADENIYNVSRIIGHRSIRTTEKVYVKDNPESLRSTIGKLNYKP